MRIWGVKQGWCGGGGVVRGGGGSGLGGGGRVGVRGVGLVEVVKVWGGWRVGGGSLLLVKGGGGAGLGERGGWGGGGAFVVGGRVAHCALSVLSRNTIQTSQFNHKR